MGEEDLVHNCPRKEGGSLEDPSTQRVSNRVQLSKQVVDDVEVAVAETRKAVVVQVGSIFHKPQCREEVGA